jgi:hypothetical protein
MGRKPQLRLPLSLKVVKLAKGIPTTKEIPKPIRMMTMSATTLAPM